MVRTPTNSQNINLECKFELIQKIQLNKNNPNHNTLSKDNHLDLIAELLKTSVSITKSKEKENQIRVRTTSLKGNLILVFYLEIFPLFTTKYLDYKDWLQILDFFKTREYIQQKQTKIDNLITIKERLNERRSLFTWNHLNNFYNLDK